jgi:hypothetical protein
MSSVSAPIVCSNIARIRSGSLKLPETIVAVPPALSMSAIVWRAPDSFCR